MHGGGWEPETPERDNARKHGCVQSRASHRALAARVLRACARIAIRGRRHTRQLRRCRRSFVDLRRDSLRPQCRCHLRMRAAAVRAAAAASDARARGVHACVAPGRSCRRPRCRQHVGQEASPRSILCARADGSPEISRWARDGWSVSGSGCWKSPARTRRGARVGNGAHGDADSIEKREI